MPRSSVIPEFKMTDLEVKKARGGGIKMRKVSNGERGIWCFDYISDVGELDS